jgi:hypothetical protein
MWKKSVTILDGGEVHNASCENNWVLDFIVDSLGDPNPITLFFKPIILK